MPATEPSKPPVCDRCGSKAFVEHAIHHGQTVRRDCGRCGRFLEFSVWYGVDQHVDPSADQHEIAEPEPSEAELAVKKRRQRTAKPKQGSLIG